MRLVRSRILICVVLLGVASACGESTTVAQLTSTSSTVRSEIAPTTRTTTEVSTTDPLETLLVTSVPARYLRQDDSVGDTGPSDLAKAVADDGEPDAQSALTSSGFVHGYQRLWETKGGDQLIVFLYQFASASGSSSYGARIVDFWKADTSASVKTIAVPQIPGAAGLEITDTSISAVSVTFSKGPYLVEVLTNGSVAADLRTLAQQIAADQYKRL